MTKEQKEYLPHQQRVLDERAELTERLTKLVAFLGSGADAIADEDLGSLMRQAEVMLEYQRILTIRVRGFK
jgi:hypothetical protein